MNVKGVEDAAMNNPSLIIPARIYSELMFYANAVDTEVGGYGTLIIDKDSNTLTIDELFFTGQVVTSVECDINAENMAKIYERILEAGEDEKIERLNLWWHSHGSMGVSFSGTDINSMWSWFGPYEVALVVNKKGEAKANLMTKTPIQIASDIAVLIDWCCDASWAENLKQVKVSKPVQNFNRYKPKEKRSPIREKPIHSLTDDEFEERLNSISDEYDEVEDAYYKSIFGDDYDGYGEIL